MERTARTGRTMVCTQRLKYAELDAGDYRAAVVFPSLRPTGNAVSSATGCKTKDAMSVRLPSQCRYLAAIGSRRYLATTTNRREAYLAGKPRDDWQYTVYCSVLCNNL